MNPCRSPETTSRPTGDTSFTKGQNEHRANRDHKVADRPHDRSENVVEHGIFEVSRIDWSGFGPADHRSVKKHGNRGQQQGSDRINVFDGIERNPSQHARGWIAAQIGHPRVSRFVDADREQERDQLEHYVDVVQGHARLVSILTRGPAIPRGWSA